MSMLISATKSRDKDQIRTLLDKGVEPNAAVCFTGRTPMHEAADEGFGDVVQLLLDHGAFINPKDVQGGATPLLLAVQSARFDTADLLLREGSSVNESNRLGATPLHKAVTNNDLQMVRLLMGYKPDLDAVDDDMWTALHYAAEQGKCEMVAYLINEGADCTKLTNYGRSAQYLAKSNQHDDVVQLLSARR